MALIKRSGSSDLDKKQQLFNECATFVNNLGASFAASRVSRGGMVFSVVVLLQDIIWYLDNSMPRFVELAGGTGCVPAFLYQIGQEGRYDGLASRQLWYDFVKHKKGAKPMDIQGLLQLSGRASDALMMTCFCVPQWTSFKDDVQQLSGALSRVADFMR